MAGPEPGLNDPSGSNETAASDLAPDGRGATGGRVGTVRKNLRRRKDASVANVRKSGFSLLPKSFRGRLAILISAVVAFALLLVLAVLPRLLDSYFRQQEEQNLNARANAVGQLLFQQIRLAQRSGTVPIITATNPPAVSSTVLAALTEPSSSDEPSYLAAVAATVAQADLQVAFYEGPTATGTPVATLQANAPATGGGQTREPGSLTLEFTITDPYWSQFADDVPDRVVAFTLSSPYTLRQETLTTVFNVLIIVAVSALSLAVIVAFVLADRLTTPVRRLTQASRALAEGRLDARVKIPPSWAPEVSELAVAFNRMAERLQESIEYIRMDRDRSRDFLADVSHELRTPVAALRTFNELLQDGAAEDPATREEFLETSHQQIDRLDWLASNLLELSKLDSGLVALDLRPDDLRAVVEGAVQQAEPGAKRKGVELAVELPGQPLRQRHDPQRLGQVMSNLIGNAVKFTPPGGSVTVTLRATRVGALIAVKDTGIGIDATELPHVFDRFFRGSRSNEVRASGSGLGLSIARSIVEMHGGRIAIASQLGKGTEVDVTLPREIATHDVMESSPRAARG